MSIDYSRLRELFIAACDLDDHQQVALINQHCADDPDMRSKIENLLRNDKTSHGILEEDITFGDEFHVDTILESRVPTSVGPYQVKRVIGEGGMGTVYLAEQLNPKRLVAVKVIRKGLLNRELFKRFELEAKVLGRLQHPGIARIHEAGLYDDGTGQRPFFAMEYVDGQPLMKYLKQHNPGLRERLKIFSSICDAVHHAHQRGVIHRDLKPANVLVDAECQTKILDFGVARTTETDLGVSKLHTLAGQLIGTLPYMSPEQANGQVSEIDIRSDVYSLGVLVYEMLTGNLPYKIEDQNFSEAVQVITERAPTPLSTVNSEYRGDLNTIVLKALEKVPQRRYQSAAALAEDIQRFLNDQPVVARPATAIYQFRKFAKRNRLLVGTIACAVALLVFGAIGATSGMLKAQRDARHVQAVNDFMSRILVAPDPSQGNANVKMVEVLRFAAPKIPIQFGEYPETEAEVSFLVGKAFSRLTIFDDAIPLLRRAYELRNDDLGPGHELTREAGGSLVFAMLTRDANTSISLANELLEHVSPDELNDAYALGLRRLIGSAQNRIGNHDDAEISLRAVVAGGKVSLGANHVLVGQACNALALVMKQRAHMGKSKNPAADRAEAIELFRSAINIFNQEFGPDAPSTLQTKLNLIDVLRHAGEFEDAENHCHEAIQLAQRFGPNHQFLSRPYKDLAFIKFELHEFEEAANYCSQVVEMTRRRTGKDSVEVIVHLTDALPIMEAAGKFETGEQYARTVSDRMGKHYGELAEQHRLYLARFFSGQGMTKQAEDLFQQIVDSGALESSQEAAAFYCLFMGEHELLAENSEKARELFAEALEHRQGLGNRVHPRIARIKRSIERTK